MYWAAPVCKRRTGGWLVICSCEPKTGSSGCLPRLIERFVAPVLTRRVADCRAWERAAALLYKTGKLSSVPGIQQRHRIPKPATPSTMPSTGRHITQCARCVDWPNRKMKISDYGRLLLLAAIWGASFLLMRIAAPVLGALPTAFFRVLFGAGGLLLILALFGTKWTFKGMFWSTLVLGIINSGIPFLMYCIAARLLPAGYSAIFNATTPLMGVVIGSLFFQETITGRKMAGVIFGLCGVALLTATGPVSMNVQVLSGACACLIATGCYGTAGFLTKRWISGKGGLDPKLVAFGSQIGACLFLAPIFGGSTLFSPVVSWGSPNVWFALLGAGIVCTAWAYILYFRLIADIGPVRSLTVTFLIPLFGVLWGYLFLGEQVSPAHLEGGGLIAIAVWLVLRQSTPAKKTHRAG